MQFTKLETQSVFARNANHAAPIYLHNKDVIGLVTTQQKVIVDWARGRSNELDQSRFSFSLRESYPRTSLQAKNTKALLLELLEAKTITKKQYDNCFSTTIINGSASIVRAW